MIDRWALPSPARTLTDIAAGIAAGEHIVFRGLADFDLRLALEPRLKQIQRHLRPVYDDARLVPSAVLWRENADWHSPDAPPPTVGEVIRVLGRDTWWIEDVALSRVNCWSGFIEAFANSARGLAPNERPTLVLCLPETANGPNGLTITERTTRCITRFDLDVAARYSTAATTAELALTVRIALAVEIAACDLPRFEALETLQYWLDAPDAVLTDPMAITKHADCKVTLPFAQLLLWRAQFGAVTYAIDQARCDLLRYYDELWRTPHTRPPSHSYPATIESPDQLELSDMIEQLICSRKPARRILEYLKGLRDARNRLSHLRPVTAATLQLLTKPFP